MSRTPGSWDPLEDLAQVQRRMNNLFENALTRADFDAPADVDTWVPVCDVAGTEEGMALWVELPGLTRDQIDVRIEGDELIVDGERRRGPGSAGQRYHRIERSYGKFSRRFHLDPGVDRDSVSASFRDGVLEIQIRARSAKGSTSRRVAVD